MLDTIRACAAMYRFGLSILLFTVSPLLLAVPTNAQRVSQEPSSDWAGVVRSAQAAVVTLKSYDAAGRPLGLGSGFRLDGGRIVTNVHVIRGAARVETFDFSGQLLGVENYAEALSASVDIAVLPALGHGGASLRLAVAEPEVGARIVVIGSPEGLSNTVSDGLVSAFRTEAGERLMQMSAPVSPGSSGGPVLNGHGNVVGVSVAFLTSGQNLNFAVPLRSLRAVVRSPVARLAFPAADTPAGLSSGTSEQPRPWPPSPPSATPHQTAPRRNVPNPPPPPVLGAPAPKLLLNRIVKGEIGRESAELPTGRRAYVYELDVKRGQHYTIVATSNDFDATLSVFEPAASHNFISLGTDDSSAGNGNPMVTVSPLRTGPVYVVISNHDAARFGRFRVRAIIGVISSGRARSRDDNETDRWVKIAVSDEASFYVDHRTLHVDPAGYVEAWVRGDLARADRERWGKYDMYMELVEIDCGRRRTSTLQVSYYLNNLPVSRPSAAQREWLVWAPGTVGEGIGQKICQMSVSK